MREHAVLGATVILLAITLASHFYPGYAVSYSVVLKAGDSAFYSLSGTYGFYPSRPGTQMNVLSVSGTNITAGFTAFFPDGILTSNVYWVDVFSGAIRNSSSTILFAVTPGLQLNDPIYNGWAEKIQNVQSVSCGGAPRQIVVTEFFPTVGFQANTVRIGWDQSTGVMCRYDFTSSDGSRTLSMGMTNTTLWSPSNPPDPFTVLEDISAAVGLPLLVLVVYVYYRKRRSRR